MLSLKKEIVGGRLNLRSYLKSNGILGAIRKFWRFKLPRLQIALVARLTKGRMLENKIIIESHNDFDCNGGAFYNWLIENGYNNDVKIVWRLYHSIPDLLPQNVSCVPVYGPSWKKAWEICTAKWLSADCTVTDKVHEDQISIYMTHGGFGLKNCRGYIKIPESVDYVLSPSPYFDDWTNWIYELNNSNSKLVHVGYPSLDRLYSRRHSNEYLPCPKRNKTILWMPTFRQAEDGIRSDSNGSYPYGVPLIDNERMLKRLAAVLEEACVHLVIKLHPKQRLSRISKSIPSAIELLTGESIKDIPMDNYDLMLDADAMIGDYSAAIYEYLVLDRPIAFVLSDLAEYKLGLIDDAEEYMVGSKIFCFDDLELFIREVASGIDSKMHERRCFLQKLYEPGNENSSEQVASLLGIKKRD